jgi:hypothetical protein
MTLTLSLFGSRFGSGQKLAEQLANLGLKPFLALTLIDMTAAANNPNPLWGSWSGDRVVLIGDYSDDLPDFLTDEEQDELEKESCTLYQMALGEFEDLMGDPKKFFEKVDMLESLFKDSKHVIVNLDKKEYLDPEQFGDAPSVDRFSLEKGGVMRGLYSKLFYSSGRGGGDIEELTNGRWAGNRLAIIEKEKLEDSYREVSGGVVREE